MRWYPEAPAGIPEKVWQDAFRQCVGKLDYLEGNHDGLGDMIAALDMATYLGRCGNDPNAASSAMVADWVAGNGPPSPGSGEGSGDTGDGAPLQTGRRLSLEDEGGREVRETQSEHEVPQDEEEAPPSGSKGSTDGSGSCSDPDDPSGEPRWTEPPEYRILVGLLRRGRDVVLTGDRGLGKTEMAVRACLEVYGTLPQVCTSPQTRSDVAGYPTADGTYVPSEVTRDIGEPGMVLLEELDRAAPRAVVYLNPVLANRLATIPGRGTVGVHPDRRFVATMNTSGVGGSQTYVSATRQDGALLDRFAVLEVRMDRGVALACAEGAPDPHGLVDFVLAWNDAVREMGVPDLLLSYRSIRGLAGEVRESGFERAFGMYVTRGIADPGTLDGILEGMAAGGTWLAQANALRGE